MKKISIKALLETSDHDGYCSGDECEYKSKIIIKLCDIPVEYENHPLGMINQENFSDDEWSNYWSKYLPCPDLNTSESYYCDLSSKCSSIGLGRHDHKYTILQVKIVDEN